MGYFCQKIIVGRIIAIDYGKVRTGIAVTDELQIIASALTTVATKELLCFLKDYSREESIEKIVVGEPKQMNNTASESEVFILPFLKNLAVTFPEISVERQDERFTSKMAFQTIIDSGIKKKQRKNKSLVDKISATIILQTYLNRIQ